MKCIERSRVFLWISLILISVFLYAGCSSTGEMELSGKTEPTGPDATQQVNQRTLTQTDKGDYAPYYVHTVKWPGETISIIAAWYTGDKENWKELVEFNRHQIKLNTIYEGMQISIPEHLMKVRDPMPKVHVDSFYPKTQKRSTVKTPTSKKQEEGSQLFGPK
jgi:hypothetical protein